MDNYQDYFLTGDKLPVIDQFYSIQGEGHQTGKPAYFIRIGGCDIGCQWCDTKVSWHPEIHHAVSINDIIDAIKKLSTDSIVVTGGEPCLYNLEPLCSQASKHSLKKYLETSGHHKITGEWDWICISPKASHPPVQENLEMANELKVIVYEEKDIIRAEQYVNKLTEDCILYLQPEWSRRKQMTSLIVEYIKENPEWNLSLQIHKYIGIP